MTDLVGRLFGDATAKRFGPMWSDHVLSVVEYGGAVADRDEPAREHAHGDLVRHEHELADFFAGASHGRLPRDAARAAVAVHVGHLTKQADAYAKRDYA